MSIIQTLQHDQLRARKEKNQVMLGTIQMLLSQIKNEEINLMKRDGLTDEEVFSVMRRFIKQQKDAIIDFEKAGRTDLIEAAETEIAFVTQYLPRMMDESEVEQIVKQIIEQTQATSQKDFGRVMGLVVKQVAGRADGTLIQSIVKKLLPSA